MRYAPCSYGRLLRRLPLASAPQGAERCAASAAALCSQHGQSARRAAARSAQLRRAGEAVPLAAAAGPGSHAQGRQVLKLRLQDERPRMTPRAVETGVRNIGTIMGGFP